MAVSEANKPILRECKNWFEWAVSVLGVANGDILGLATIKGTSTTTSLVGMIGAKACKEVDIPMRRQCQDAMVVALNVQAFGATEAASNTAIAAADTVNGVRSLFNTADSSLSATARDNYSSPYPIGHAQPLS